LNYETYIQKKDSILQLKIGVPFPDFTITNVNGNTLSKQELQGKITVVNFWFESCAPCIAELNSLNTLFQKFKDNPDFQFVSFTIDSIEIAKEAIKKFGILFDVYPITKKESERLFCAGFPTNLIVDKNGKVAYVKEGGYLKDRKSVV
jgi:peroxiredoxin